jgi:hypothetical protein
VTRLEEGSRVADATAALFDELSRRGHEPLLDQAAGRVRFELFDESQTDVWLVTLNKGDIAVSREPLDADCVVRTQKTACEEILNCCCGSSAFCPLP